MAARTRLGLWGHNARRTGSFAGKTPAPLPAAVEPAFAAFADALVTLLAFADARVTAAAFDDGAVTNASLSNH